MAFLSVSLPWQSLVAAHLPELRAGFTREHPAVAVHLMAGESALAATLEVNGVNPAQAAFAIAEYLAPLWPALLADHGVELTVKVDGATWVAGPGAMVRLAAGGVAREGWLAEARFSVGG